MVLFNLKAQNTEIFSDSLIKPLSSEQQTADAKDTEL